MPTSLPPEANRWLLERIDESVDLFESQLKSGNNPEIESFLEGWHDPELSKLLAELVGVEQEFRVHRGDKPSLSEYRNRFPRHQDVIDKEFPATLGNYDLLELVGLGAFGRVYHARLKGTNICHAVKILYERKGTADLDLVVKEFQALAKIKHPAIVTAHTLDIGLTGASPYLAMEYVEGKSLQEALRSGRIPIALVLRLVSETAQALGAAHAAGIIHRDLKPANILIDPEWHPHLTDFGLALLNGQRHAQCEELAGTLAYIPPEYTRSEVADPRSDIWSLGVIFYEMLTGETPFQGETRVVLFNKIQNEQPTEPRVLRPDLSPKIQQACLRCLEKDRNKRWSTAYDLATALGGPLRVSPRSTKAKGLFALVCLIATFIATLVLVPSVGYYYSHLSTSDSSIFFAIQSDLQDDPTLQYANIRITVRNAVVTLSGEVHQESDRIRAADIAGHEADVREVINNLGIAQQPSAQETLSQRAGSSRPKVIAQSSLNAASGRNTVLLPLNWILINALQRVGDAVYVGGRSRDGGTLARFQIESGTFSDLTHLLPTPWCPVSTLAYGANRLFVGGGSRGGCAGQLSLLSGSFEDVTPQLHANGADFYYYGGVGAVGFNGREFLIGGAGKRTSLDFYSPETGRFTSSGLRPYFAVNTIASDGNSFLVAGAGPGPGPQQPPAVGWVSPTHGFTNLTASLPPNWGTTRRSAYNGTQFMIQGVDRATGTNEMLAILDGPGKTTRDLTSSLPQTLHIHALEGHDGYFLIGGQMGQKAYLARYREGMHLTDLSTLLPEESSDVSAVTIVGSNIVAGGVSRAGPLFIASFPDRTHNVDAKLEELQKPERPDNEGRASLFTLERTLDSDSLYPRIAYSSGGSFLASIWDKTIKVWNPVTGEVTRTLTGHTDKIMALAASPSGVLIASGGRDHTIRLWDVESGAAIRTITGLSDVVWALAFSADGRTLASAGADGSISLWDSGTGGLLRTLYGHRSWILSLAFSPDNRLLVSGGRDRTLRFWDFATGRLLATLADAFVFHVGPAGQEDWPPYAAPLAFRPDGGLLASASADSTIRLWDPSTHTMVGALRGHEMDVFGLAFSPDGLLASGGTDRTIKIWDPTTANLLSTLTGHTASVSFLVFSPDGRRLASASNDRTIKIWKRQVAAGE